MKKQQEKLSYARLVTRADFYKKKALELEQQVVFAKENAHSLEQQLEQLAKKHDETVVEDEKKFNLLRENHDQLGKEYSSLKTQHDQLQSHLKEQKEKWGREIEEVENEREVLKSKLVEKEKEIENLKDDENDEKIKGFEKLLSDVQVELNEKEALIDSYQKRIKSLEQRLNLNRSIPVNKVFSEMKESRRIERKAIAYFDYSIIIDAKKEAVIRGNFHIDNAGSTSLGTPFVCFRFYPVDAAALKGKILTLDQLPLNEGGRGPRWVYMDGEWGNSAKERGEIWVRPYEEWTLNPDDSLTLSDFQIAVKKHYDENVIVEGFVYFQKDEYKQKAVNQILISF